MTRRVSGTELTGEFPKGSMGIDKGGMVMLYTIIGILVVLWLLGFTMNVGGGLIHALLVIAVIVFVFNLLSGRRSSG